MQNNLRGEENVLCVTLRELTILKNKMDVKLFVFGKKTHLLCMEVYVIQTMINMNFSKRKSRKMKNKIIEIDMCIHSNKLDI